MNHPFEEEVFRRFDRIENKVDGVVDKTAELDKRMAVADAKHGILGAMAGIAASVAAYFIAPHR